MNTDPSGSARVARDSHAEAVAALASRYKSFPPEVTPRLRKKTSNLFRFSNPAHTILLDVDAFDDVLWIDRHSRTAQVGGMATYETVVEKTLAHNLMPLVVPQLRTITMGGAVAGLGIESTSFRNGLPHESVRELEILTGSGDVVTANPTRHGDLFEGFPNSYGTLGYALSLTVDLAPVRNFVRLRHLRFDNSEECAAAIAELAAPTSEVDFLDGVYFSDNEIYLTLGDFVDAAPYTSNYTSRHIYYRSIQERELDYLTIHDYIWRWDADWFWCSRPFGLQNRWIRPLWPQRWRRSDVYHRLIAWDRRLGVSRSIDRIRGKRMEPVIQDVEIPIGEMPGFLDEFKNAIGITPIWLCPARTHGTWPLYPMKPGALYVNLGFWSSVPLRKGQKPDHHNRLVEELVASHGGHKSLYSTVHYSADEFWERYNGSVYRKLKSTYDPENRLPDLYDKCSQHPRRTGG